MEHKTMDGHPVTVAPWRARLIAEAHTWLHTPWHHAARVRGAGVDCGQLLIACYAGAGLIEPVDTGAYPMDWMLHRDEERYLSWVTRYLDEVDAPEPGDVAAWQVGRCFSHGAVVLQWPNILHAYRPAGGVCLGDATRGPLALQRSGAARPVRFFSIAARLAGRA
jgi:cell wall-associated NlpC family hydrolase